MTAPELARRSALVVGMGGLGCPAALALCRAGFGKVVLLDEDEVDETNLHRQILYAEAQIGMPKLEAARSSLLADGAREDQLRCLEGRLLPHTARQYVADVDVVVEGTDNYATKFLTADACYLERTHVVHGAALGWRATAMAVSAEGAPCYRCLFEDIPEGPDQPTCASGGVMGPVVGFAGAVLAELAIRLVSGARAAGSVVSYDGRTDQLRVRDVGPRSSCALCGTAPTIRDTPDARYTGAICAT